MWKVAEWWGRDEHKAYFKIIVSETVQKFLCDFIQKKNLQPGDQLPSERELAKLLEVGRSSVREALQTLSEKGV
ncbi:FadR/GntR family transcriptional regulator [Aneurinibacillus migulanus]|uniref:FadR/GntR family transcriptional regulator n=1 Tax=Aneurinibacillus migulanus TaxID=47500 RepID=UPI0020A00FB0|nr:winged helix-turn-helix domain-containing protein [Aneurinibacillus migulanus]